MLSQLMISNFKCFDSLILPLAPLTLMTGFNAAGKSTALQPILLFAQSLRLANRSAELPLNGPLVQLGNPGEVIRSGRGNVFFGLEDEEIKIVWEFQPESRTKGNSLRIKNVFITKDQKKHVITPQVLDMLLPPPPLPGGKKLVENLRETIFISAVRMGTAEVFPSPEAPSPVYADAGMQGEYAPWWFQRFLDEEIEKSRCHSSEPANILRRQFNAWANELFPAAQGNAVTIEKTNLVRLELRIGNVGEWRRPANIGYGLTYAFPIIVAGLLAKRGQIIIIDSPEAHLHPLGQSKMGIFLAKIAAAGVQVFIETHSDHIINGMRLAVRNEDIEPSSVAIHFFNHVTDMVDSSRIVSMEIDRQGNLSEWPEGFCDQTEKDLTCLAGLS